MTSVNLDPLRGEVEILRLVKQRKLELKKLEEAARAAIEEKMGEHTTGLLDGDVAIIWRRYKERRLDQEALKEADPSTHELYVRVQERRRFEVVDDE